MSWKSRKSLVLLSLAVAGLIGAHASGPTIAVLGPAPLLAQVEPPPDGIFLRFSGGPVLGKRALTHTGSLKLDGSNTAGWTTLPNSIPLTWNVKAGTSDLFNVTFSAQCSFREYPVGFLGNSHHIRILDLNTGLVMNPYEEPESSLEKPSLEIGGRRLCASHAESTALPGATHSGTWARRMDAGPHNLVVQFFVWHGELTIDDWTFELVVYD